MYSECLILSLLIQFRIQKKEGCTIVNNIFKVSVFLEGQASPGSAILMHTDICSIGAVHIYSSWVFNYHLKIMLTNAIIHNGYSKD